MNEQRMKRKMLREASTNLGYWEDQIKFLKYALANIERALSHAEAQKTLAMMKCKETFKSEE